MSDLSRGQGIGVTIILSNYWYNYRFHNTQVVHRIVVIVHVSYNMRYKSTAVQKHAFQRKNDKIC